MAATVATTRTARLPTTIGLCSTSPPQAGEHCRSTHGACGNPRCGPSSGHNRGMLRLDPAYPPLWRSATALQFGADAIAVVDDPTPWQQRLVHELARGIPDDALEPVAAAFGAPDRAAAAFVRRLAPAMAIARPVEARRLTLQIPAAFPDDRATVIANALVASGFELALERWHDAPDERIPDGTPLVLLAEHVVQPRRAAMLMARDIPHLPIVFTGTGADVGPYVLPGRTACLACLAAERRDEDPSWPLVAAQLIGRTVEDLDPSIAGEAAIVAARLISESGRGETTSSLTLRAGSLHRISREHRPHADCRCRSLAGSATADDPADLEPTTATASAPPA
jgi:hypothetical protein